MTTFEDRSKAYRIVAYQSTNEDGIWWDVDVWKKESSEWLGMVVFQETADGKYELQSVSSVKGNFLQVDLAIEFARQNLGTIVICGSELN